MNKLLIFFLLSITSLISYADHTKGGWMYYEYLGAGSTANTAKYKIVLYLYAKKSSTVGNNAQINPQISLTIFNGDQRLQDALADLKEYPDVENCQCNPCIINSPKIDYKYATYETIIDLPINTNGYTIAFQRCCRINGIINIQSPSSDYGDTWTIKIPGTSNGPTATQNSSPKFIFNDTTEICANNFFKFNFTATDPDGDSLVYEFAPAFVGGSRANPIPGIPSVPSTFTSVPYAAPYSASDPLGLKVTLDRKTGVVSGIAPPNIGDYVITAVAKEYRNGVYIAESRKSLHVQVASCNLVAAKLLDDNTCDGFTKSFKNNVPDPAGAAYQWDFGVAGITTDVSNLPNPTYSYADTGTYKVKLTISISGMCSDSAIALVKVYPKLNTDFLPTGECKNTAIRFNDKTQTTYGTVNSWLWNFGDPTSGNANNESALQNPAHNFATAGNYTVSLTTQNSKGCINTISKTIEIKDKPDLTVTNDTLICSIDTLQLNAVGGGTIQWTPNYNINNQSSASPLVSPDVPTKYYVTLTDPFGCIAFDSVFVDVKLFVTIDAGKDTGICAGDNIQLSPISDALQYQWSPAASLDDPFLKNPTASPTTTTKYYVVGNIGKCQSFDSILVRVAPYPGGAGIPDTVLCFGNSIQLNATGGSMYTWSPSFFLNNTSIPNPIANPDRSIRYIVTIRDTLGCPKPVYDTIFVKVERVTANAGPRDTSIVLNQPLQLNGSGGDFYLWSPTTGLNNPGIANPIATLNDDMEYVLRVSTAAGCFATDTISIKVFKVLPGIYVPTGFTPNGDGNNDVFQPIPIGIKSITRFKVFNRWGVLMYSSESSFYEHPIGWDGKYKGRPQDSGVYVWIVEGINYLDKKITQKGSVTLIR